MISYELVSFLLVGRAAGLSEPLWWCQDGFTWWFHPLGGHRYALRSCLLCSCTQELAVHRLNCLIYDLCRPLIKWGSSCFDCRGILLREPSRFAFRFLCCLVVSMTTLLSYYARRNSPEFFYMCLRTYFVSIVAPCSIPGFCLPCRLSDMGFRIWPWRADLANGFRFWLRFPVYNVWTVIFFSRFSHPGIVLL